MTAAMNEGEMIPFALQSGWRPQTMHAQQGLRSQVPPQPSGRSVATPAGYEFMSIEDQVAQQRTFISMIKFLNCVAYFPRQDDWIEWVREFGLLGPSHPFGPHVWEALGNRIQKLRLGLDADMVRNTGVKSWFYPPSNWSRRNSRETSTSEDYAVTYCGAYPCIALPVYAANGDIVEYRFICLAMIIWMMIASWFAHPTRILSAL